jgi:hypothetical protein
MVLVAREGMSTSQFFCSIVLQLVEYESHSEDVVGYGPNVVARACLQLICQLEGNQSQTNCF